MLISDIIGSINQPYVVKRDYDDSVFPPEILSGGEAFMRFAISYDGDLLFCPDEYNQNKTVLFFTQQTMCKKNIGRPSHVRYGGNIGPYYLAAFEYYDEDTRYFILDGDTDDEAIELFPLRRLYDNLYILTIDGTSYSDNPNEFLITSEPRLLYIGHSIEVKDWSAVRTRIVQLKSTTLVGDTVYNYFDGRKLCFNDWSKNSSYVVVPFEQFGGLLFRKKDENFYQIYDPGRGKVLFDGDPMQIKTVTLNKDLVIKDVDFPVDPNHMKFVNPNGEKSVLVVKRKTDGKINVLDRDSTKPVFDEWVDDIYEASSYFVGNGSGTTKILVAERNGIKYGYINGSVVRGDNFVYTKCCGGIFIIATRETENQEIVVDLYQFVPFRWDKSSGKADGVSYGLQDLWVDGCNIFGKLQNGVIGEFVPNSIFKTFMFVRESTTKRKDDV